jgi:hypothetical protein
LAVIPAALYVAEQPVQADGSTRPTPRACIHGATFRPGISTGVPDCPYLRPYRRRLLRKPTTSSARPSYTAGATRTRGGKAAGTGVSRLLKRMGRDATVDSTFCTASTCCQTAPCRDSAVTVRACTSTICSGAPMLLSACPEYVTGSRIAGSSKSFPGPCFWSLVHSRRVLPRLCSNCCLSPHSTSRLYQRTRARVPEYPWAVVGATRRHW